MKIGYEPFSEVVRDDPYPYYAALREHAPIYWAEEAQAFCVSRHADVQAVLRSPELFSSDAMRTMLVGMRPGADPLRDADAMQRVLVFAEALPFPQEDLIAGRNLISEDPPRHDVLRMLVNRGFTPRRIAAWEPRMRQIVGECMEVLRDGDEFDVVADLGIPLPVRIIAEMLGVEPERREDFKRWSDQVISATTGMARGGDTAMSGMAAAIRALAEYIQDVVTERGRSIRGK